MSNDQTRLSAYLKKLQDHPVISLIILFCICLMAISTFITQMDSGYSTISKRVSPAMSNEDQKSHQKPEILSNTKEIEEEKPSQILICQKCNEIFAKGLEYLTQGRVSKPSGSNAYESYLELRKIDKELAEKLLEAIRIRLRQLVQSETKVGNLLSADRHLNTLVTIDGKYDTSDLLRSIKKRRLELIENPSIEAKPTTKIEKIEPLSRVEITSNKDIELQITPKAIDLPRPPTSSPPINPTNTVEAETKTSDGEYLNEWISAVCASVSATYGDSAKVGILQTAINDEPSITGTTVYKLYNCANIYSDAYKVNAIQTMAKKMSNRSLAPAHYSKIINDLYSDSYKASAAAVLIPYIKK